MNKLTLRETLKLLQAYGKAINDDMARIEIYDDESGAIIIGTSNADIAFSFETIEELVDGLTNIRTE